jgi:hypothetical protein
MNNSCAAQKCIFCKSPTTTYYKFAVNREDSTLKEYTGNLICFRYVCPNCAFDAFHIANQFPKEVKAKK